jgi:hypothetical protein
MGEKRGGGGITVVFKPSVALALSIWPIIQTTNMQVQVEMLFKGIGT